MILFAHFRHYLSIKMQRKDMKSISFGNYKNQVVRFQTPHAGIANAARGNDKRRTRRSQSPHAEMTNAARGDCNPRTRRF